MTTTAFGVDIGGSGIKAAMVDVDTGDLRSERVLVATPDPSTPAAVAEVVRELVSGHGWTGPVGAAFPAVVKHGITLSAANVDNRWIGTDADRLFTEVTGCEVVILNDADAVGLAEVRYGAAGDVSGLVIVLTFGTGIGSALVLDGALVPNSELGHLELDGYEGESRAAASIKDREGLTWDQWVPRVQRYVSHVEMLFTPDLFVFGGGVSRHAERWIPRLELRTPIRPAELHNDAGIVGAALAATRRRGPDQYMTGE